MVNIVAFPISSLRRKWLFHYQGENFKCCIKIEAFPTPQDCVQFSSVTQSCPILCGPMDCSTPGLLVHHQLLEFTQTHGHWVGDAIQPSHLLSYLGRKEGNPQDPFPSSSHFNVMLESGGVFSEYKTQKSICVTMHVQVSCTLFARLVLEPNCET